MSDKADAKNKIEQVFEGLRESGALKDEASESAPDYENAEFENTEGQRYVENKREAVKALPGHQQSWAEKIGGFITDLVECVFYEPYFSWPEPDFAERAEDPLAFTGKDRERLMELADIDPDDDPLSGVAPQAGENKNFLPKFDDTSFQRRAFEVIRERAQDADAEFYGKAINSISESSEEEGFQEFLGNALMNETAEGSGWVEDKAGIGLQELVDRAVAKIEARENVDQSELEAFVRSVKDLEESDYPFDLQHFGEVEALYGVLAEALEEQSGDDLGYYYRISSEEDAFSEVVRVFGKTYQKAIKEHQDLDTNNDK